MSFQTFFYYALKFIKLLGRYSKSVEPVILASSHKRTSPVSGQRRGGGLPHNKTAGDIVEARNIVAGQFVRLLI